MVAVGDERAHAVLAEALQRAMQAQLGTDAPLGAVVHVAGDHEEGGALVERQGHETVERLE